MEISAAKKILRQTMRARRRAVAPDERRSASSAICARLLARADVREILSAKGTLAAYCASPEEIDLSELVAAWRTADAPVAVPRWNGETYALAYLEGPMREGPHGIREPQADASVACADVALWIVPGLAFTPAGERLGYGGGWYDRFLTAAAPSARALGVGYGFQLVDALPTDIRDRRLHAVVCPA